MSKPEDAYEKDAPSENEDTFLEGRDFRIPGRLVPASKKRRPRKPGSLAPDAKRYNDEIPDPDSEVIVPE
ncbi:MAG: hypothetical protein WD024_04195 [Bacillota bacterium]